MKTLSESQKTLIIGLGLIVIGSLVFTAQFVNIGWLIMPFLASMFLVLGIFTRDGGWFIPSGILYGISAGVWLSERYAQGNEALGSGLFFLAFAAGWLVVFLLPRLFRTTFKADWALIVSGVLSIVGLAALGPANVGLVGNLGQWILRGVGYLWPFALMAWGIWLVINRNKPSHKES